MSSVFAVFLAGVFVVAAAFKLRDPAGTRSGFSDLGLPFPGVLAWLVPVLEVLVALLLIVLPGWGGVAGFALLLGFTVVLVVTIRSGRTVPCRCFGGTSDAPVSWGQVVRNAGLLVLSAFVATIDELTRPSTPQVVAALALLALGSIATGMADRRFRVAT